MLFKIGEGENKVTGLLYSFINSDVLVFAIQRKFKIFYKNVLHNYLSVMNEAVLEVFLQRIYSALSYTMSLVDHVLVILIHVYFLVLAVVQQVHTVKYRHICDSHRYVVSKLTICVDLLLRRVMITINFFCTTFISN